MLTRRNIENILFNGMSQLMNVAFPLLMLPYVSRVLGVEGIGAANLALITATYFSTLASMGIPIYGIREVGKVKGNSDKLNNVVSELILINAFFCVLSLILYVILINQIEVMANNIAIYYIAMVNIVLSFFQVDWIFQGLGRFKIITIRSLIVKSLSLVMIYTLINDSDDIGAFVFINVIALTFGNIINFYYIRKNFKLKCKDLRFKQHMKPIIFFFSTRVMSSVYTLLDSVILGIMTSNYYVGLYTIAIRIIRVITTLIASVVTVFFAESSKMKIIDFDKYKDININLFIFLNLISIPTASFIFIFADNIIFLFSGEQFYEAGDTIRILSFLVYISIMTNFIGVQILYVNGKEKLVAVSLGIGAIVCVISNVIFIPLFNHNGAAISAVLAETAILIFQIYVVYKGKLMNNWLTLNTIYRLALPGALYTVMLFFINTYYFELGLTSLIISIILSLPIYFMLLVFFKEPLVKLIMNRIIR